MRNRIVEIEDRSEDLKDLLSADPAFRADFLRKLELTFLHHENALEGVVYSIQELDAALRGVTVAEASVMNGYRDILNHKAALELVRAEAAAKKPRVTLALVKKLHETLAAGYGGKDGAAELRKEMPLHRTYFHDIAQPPKIAALLQKLVDLAESADFKALHAVQRSARFQHEFMRIFPFTDHSGRIARLIGNMFLMNAGLDAVVVHAVDRQRYYESFRLGEPQLRELLVDSLENQLVNAEKFVRATLRERRGRTAGGQPRSA
jgi:Fic family protein